MLNEDKNEKRIERHKITQEDFTPEWVIENFLSYKDDDPLYTNHKKTFLDPAAGTGNIICNVLKKRLNNGIPYKKALSTLYGTELMEDNVGELKMNIQRLIADFCTKGSIPYDRKAIDKILNKNMVCTDAFKWDYDNWKPKEKEKTLFDDDPIWQDMNKDKDTITK